MGAAGQIWLCFRTFDSLIRHYIYAGPADDGAEKSSRLTTLRPLFLRCLGISPIASSCAHLFFFSFAYLSHKGSCMQPIFKLAMERIPGLYQRREILVNLINASIQCSIRKITPMQQRLLST